MDGQLNIVLWFAAGAICMALLAAALHYIRRTAYLSPVKRELKKEKQWLRRGEYNAAMVKGRQNLELLFKLVAENNGIHLDNTAQAVANAKNGQERGNGRQRKQRRNKVLTHQQFTWWLDENGYLDRVAKWEINEVRLIGNKAVHENFTSKEDAWNQYNYLEDILKIVSEKSPVHLRRQNQKRDNIKENERDSGRPKENQKERKGQNPGKQGDKKDMAEGNKKGAQKEKPLQSVKRGAAAQSTKKKETSQTGESRKNGKKETKQDASKERDEKKNGAGDSGEPGKRQRNKKNPKSTAGAENQTRERKQNGSGKQPHTEKNTAKQPGTRKEDGNIRKAPRRPTETPKPPVQENSETVEEKHPRKRRPRRRRQSGQIKPVQGAAAVTEAAKG